MSKIDLTTAQKEGYVIGLNGESGIYPRREIDDLMVNDPDCFNLYVLALERIMKDEAGKQNKMNYFQVAGIHGLPLIDWDGVSNPIADSPGSYCTHASFLFPSWHRPYLAMMEQTLYSNMKDIAGKFDDPKYLQAVKRFRLPFWDWIKAREKRTTVFPGVGRNAGQQVSFKYNYDLPAILQLPTLRVYRPESQKKLVDIDNPFAKYTFPKVGSIPVFGTGSWGSLEEGDDEENQERRDEARRRGQRATPMVHASRNRTVRSPSTNFGEADGLGRVNQSLNMMRESSVENALNLILLRDYDNYLDFAAEAPRRSGGRRVGPAGSLEDIHNRYHGLTGGDGHMGRVPVAAFDPIFWLHHCNIDRMLTVWQAVHSGSNSYLPAGKGEYGRDLPLWPFRKDGKNSFWTSTGVQDHTTFGYTYADVQGLSRTDILNRWNQGYRWSLQSNDLSAPPEWMKPISVRGAQALNFTEAAESTTPVFTTMATLNTVLSQKAHAIQLEDQKPLTIEKQDPTAELETHNLVEIPDESQPLASNDPAQPPIQWYIDVEVQRNFFNGAFTLYYFLSSTPLDLFPSDYPTSPSLAGLTHIFTAPRSACDACNLHAANDLTVTSTAPITPMLRDYVKNTAELRGLGPEDVVPFLKKCLYVRVKRINNVEVDWTQDWSSWLRIGVSSVTEGEAGEGSETREWDDEVMEGRRGGDPVAA